MTEIIIVPIAYLLGCLCCGYYLVYLRTRQDIRLLGSGSVGAKNVLRVLGPRSSFVTLAVDSGKGALAVGIAVYFEVEPPVLVLAAVAVVVGHIWPIQLAFRGGKGIATALGALVILDSVATFSLILLFCLAYALSHRFAFSGLLVISMSPLVPLLLGRPLLSMMCFVALMPIVLFAHRKNIREMMVNR